MKICTKCGAYNSDDRKFCVDCSEKLGNVLSASEERQMRDNLNKRMDEMYNRNEPLYVSKFDKAIGAVSIAGILCCAALLIIGKITQRSFELLWAGIIIFLLACVEAFMPKVTWAVRKLRLRFSVSNARIAEPSRFYMYCRKAAVVFMAVMGIVILATNLRDFKHPPIRRYISDIAATESVEAGSSTRDYINANPDKWEKILNEGDYTIGIFVSELEKADSTGLDEWLMMEAVTEISGINDMFYTNKDDFLLVYSTYGW